MTRTLKSIAPLQLGKMMGVLYGLMGLVFIPLFVVFAIIGMIVQPESQANSSAGAAGAIAIGGALIMSLIMPVMYESLALSSERSPRRFTMWLHDGSAGSKSKSNRPL